MTNGRAIQPLSETAAPLARGLELDAARMALLRRTIAKDCTTDELHLFLAVAARLRLDPLSSPRQIHPIKDRKSGRFYLHVGIDGRRVIAQRTGLVDGMLGPFWADGTGTWHDAWLWDDPPHAAKVGVLRKGGKEPFWGVCHWKGFNQNTGRWQTDGPGMLAKAAEDHALRKAFPYEMGSVPGAYDPTQDEDASEGDFRQVDVETGEIKDDVALPELAAPSEPPIEAYTEEAGQAAVESFGGNYKPPVWVGTDLEPQIRALAKQLDAAGKKYALPSDDATPSACQGWISAKKGLLAHPFVSLTLPGFRCSR